MDRDEREARAQIIETMLTEGKTHKAIAGHLGVSAPAITQAINRSPRLRRYNRSSENLMRLRYTRHELTLIAQEIARLQSLTRRTMNELDDDIASIERDRLLGLR